MLQMMCVILVTVVTNHAARSPLVHPLVILVQWWIRDSNSWSKSDGGRSEENPRCFIALGWLDTYQASPIASVLLKPDNDQQALDMVRTGAFCFEAVLGYHERAPLIPDVPQVSIVSVPCHQLKPVPLGTQQGMDYGEAAGKKAIGYARPICATRTTRCTHRRSG